MRLVVVARSAASVGGKRCGGARPGRAFGLRGLSSMSGGDGDGKRKGRTVVDLSLDDDELREMIRTKNMSDSEIEYGDMPKWLNEMSDMIKVKEEKQAVAVRSQETVDFTNFVADRFKRQDDNEGKACQEDIKDAIYSPNPQSELEKLGFEKSVVETLMKYYHKPTTQEVDTEKRHR